MYETRYHRPETLSQALEIFADAEDGRYLAGGQTLIPVMKQRLAAPSDVIDIARLDALQGLTLQDGVLTVGAGVTHAEIAAADDVRRSLPALAALAGGVGDPAVRRMGTLGGSLANNDPAADHPAAALALDASIRTDRRALDAEAFQSGLFETALEPGELVVDVSFKVPAAAAYGKFRNPASGYAMAGVFVARHSDGSVRVAVTGAGAGGAFRLSELETALAGRFDVDAVDDVEIDAAQMLDDLHGPAAYRANLVRVMARRAIAAIA